MSPDTYKRLIQHLGMEYSIFVNTSNEEDMFFTCPECDEPILYIDYGNDIELNEDIEGRYFECPICGGRIDV